MEEFSDAGSVSLSFSENEFVPSEFKGKVEANLSINYLCKFKSPIYFALPEVTSLQTWKLVRNSSNFRSKFSDLVQLSSTSKCQISPNIIPDCEQNWKSFPLREQLLPELCFLKLDSNREKIRIKLEDCGITWNLKQIMLLNFIRLAVHHLPAAKSISKPWKHSRRK